MQKNLIDNSPLHVFFKEKPKNMYKMNINSKK